MSRAKLPIHNFRIEVYPDLGYRADDEGNNAARIEGLVRDCREIEQAIKRHVDGVSSVRVVYDTEFACSYCGSQWTETSHDYNGGCCDADEDNNPEPQP